MKRLFPTQIFFLLCSLIAAPEVAKGDIVTNANHLASFLSRTKPIFREFKVDDADRVPFHFLPLRPAFDEMTEDENIRAIYFDDLTTFRFESNCVATAFSFVETIRKSIEPSTSGPLLFPHVYIAPSKEFFLEHFIPADREWKNYSAMVPAGISPLDIVLFAQKRTLSTSETFEETLDQVDHVAVFLNDGKIFEKMNAGDAKYQFTHWSTLIETYPPETYQMLIGQVKPTFTMSQALKPLSLFARLLKENPTEKAKILSMEPAGGSILRKLIVQYDWYADGINILHKPVLIPVDLTAPTNTQVAEDALKLKTKLETISDRK